MPGIASSATSVVIGYVAGGTQSIRVGSGGIMLPNHAPLVIAEQFGTLEAMYPGRIDLGLGRAPGSDQLTAEALRRDPSNGHYFPQHVQELMAYFDEKSKYNRVRAIPGKDSKFRSGCSAPAISALLWLLRWACRSPSPVIFRRIIRCRRWLFTGDSFSRLRCWTNLTPWLE